jgi:hypothetical protein
MSVDTTDPFATGTTSEDDPFATPTTEFVEIADLDGRLIVVLPDRIEQANGKSDGKPYDKVIGDVIVVDGPTTDKITELPFVVEDMHLSSKMVVGQLRPKVGKGVPVLARVNSKPSSFNRQVKAYGLGDPTDADRGKALPAYRQYMADKASATFQN